jgi:glycosyltransferase involved in cell wall biosynthesis
MKFCLISENHIDEAIGGAELQCKYIAQELTKYDNIEVFHIYKSSKRKKMFNENGINSEPIYIPKYIQKIISHFVPIKLKLIIEYIFLKRKMKKIRADYWYYRSVNTFLVSLVKIKHKIGGKLIYALSRDMQSNKEKWIYSFGDLYHKRFEKSLSSVDYFIFQKQSQKTKFLEEYGYDGIVIYNGHPSIQSFKKEKSINPSVEPIKIIWVGKKRFKQPNLFLELVNKLKHLNIEFHMIGKSPYEDEDKILDMSIKVDNFNYHGELENKEVLKMISSSNLTISTSTIGAEGFPNVFIESWKFGVPVLAFNNPDGILYQYNVGFVCNNVEEMSDKIQYLATKPDIYKQLSYNCLKLFKKNFNIEKNVNSMLEHINFKIN